MKNEKYVCLNVSQNADDILTVELNRPELHNAFNAQLIRELIELSNELKNNTKIRVIVLTGKGKSFCAGADLNWMKETKTYTYERNLDDAKELGLLFSSWNDLPQAVIGRINGSAIGGGTGLVSICDVAVGIIKAKFSFSEVNLGLIPAVISPFVISKIGFSNARELFTTGERFSSERAKQIGLLNYVTDSIESLDDKVHFLTDQILVSGPNAVTSCKRLVNTMNPLLEKSIFDLTAQTIAQLRVSDEAQEGIGSFLEKRQPNWQRK